MPRRPGHVWRPADRRRTCQSKGALDLSRTTEGRDGKPRVPGFRGWLAIRYPDRPQRTGGRAGKCDASCPSPPRPWSPVGAARRRNAAYRNALRGPHRHSCAAPGRCSGPWPTSVAAPTHRLIIGTSLTAMGGRPPARSHIPTASSPPPARSASRIPGSRQSPNGLPPRIAASSCSSDPSGRCDEQRPDGHAHHARGELEDHPGAHQSDATASSTGRRAARVAGHRAAMAPTTTAAATIAASWAGGRPRRRLRNGHDRTRSRRRQLSHRRRRIPVELESISRSSTDAANAVAA